MLTDLEGILPGYHRPPNSWSGDYRVQTDRQRRSCSSRHEEKMAAALPSWEVDTNRKVFLPGVRIAKISFCGVDHAVHRLQYHT